MTKHNAANERVKREYYQYLKEAKGRDDATIDAVAKSLARFEDSTGRKDFRRFHREQAVAFKRRLANALSKRTGERLSKATMMSTLRDLRAFFFWLAHLPGFKSQVTYADADYFNLSEGRRGRTGAARQEGSDARTSRTRPFCHASRYGHRTAGPGADRLHNADGHTRCGADVPLPSERRFGRRLRRSGRAYGADQVRQDLPDILHARQ